MFLIYKNQMLKSHAKVWSVSGGDAGYIFQAQV